MSWRTYVPLLAAVIMVAGIVALSNGASLKLPTPAVSSVASSTESASSSPLAAGAANAVASSSPTPKPTPEQIAAAAAQITSLNLTHAGANLLHSVVNILCIPAQGNPLHGASASGVIIDSRGLIITAAHIGEYFLLQDYPKPNSLTCTIRTGAPAEDAYTASLVYISPSWIEDNADTLAEAAPKGTGENDFAILAITGSATSTPLPPSFPFVPLSYDLPQVGEKVAIAGYPAQYLGSTQIEDNLDPTIVFNSISNRFTFATDTIDVIAIAGTPAAQEGSSGGGVADSNNSLIGIVTTSSIKGAVANHVLNAITPLHMRASFEADMGSDLDTYLASNSLSTLVSDFAPEASRLRQVLINALFK